MSEKNKIEDFWKFVNKTDKTKRTNATKTFNVSAQQIYSIKTGKTWGHVCLG